MFESWRRGRVAWRDGAKSRLEEEVELRALVRVTCSALPARATHGHESQGSSLAGTGPMGLSGAVCDRAVLALAIRVLHGLVRSLLRRGASLRVRPVRGGRSRAESQRIKVFERRCFAGVQWIRTRALQTGPRLF
jgi:hypothetical protein